MFLLCRAADVRTAWPFNTWHLKGIASVVILPQKLLGCIRSHVDIGACISPSLSNHCHYAEINPRGQNRRTCVWFKVREDSSLLKDGVFRIHSAYYIAEHDKTSPTTISSGSNCPRTDPGVSWSEGRENLVLKFDNLLDCDLCSDIVYRNY